MAMFTCSLELLRWKTLFHQVWILLTAKSWSELRVRCANAAEEEFNTTGNIADMLASLGTKYRLFLNCLSI